MRKVSCTGGIIHSPSIQLQVGVLRFLYMTYICSFYFKAKTQWIKGMSDYDSGNTR